MTYTKAATTFFRYTETLAIFDDLSFVGNKKLNSKEETKYTFMACYLCHAAGDWPKN